MKNLIFRNPVFLFAFAFVSSANLHTAIAQPDKDPASSSQSSSHKKKAHKPHKGKASYYGKEFYGKKMADGTRMDPSANIAASKTLPLGTEAKVTNLDNGKSEVVQIRDRGPYVDGRVIDVSPSTAEKLGFKKEGVAPVVVHPINVPDKKSSQSDQSSTSNGTNTETK